MKRNPSKLTEKNYDLVIIGGGIHGATAAWDATSRGLSVALVEKGDFGSSTSSNSQKIIHGGLRYIQHGDFKRVRESVRERKILMRIAPQIVHPVPCLIPTYGHFMRILMHLALKIFDIISFDRNSLSDPQKHIPNGKMISKEECMRMIPGIKKDGLTGGAIWYDGQVYNTERMVLSFIRSAVNAGADIVNYTEAIDFIEEKNQIKGLKVRDMINGEELQIRAKITLNTSGPWAEQILNMLKVHNSPKIQFSKMMVLVANRIFVKDYAFGIPLNETFKDGDAIVNKGYRLLFITPWRNYSLIGTAQKVFKGLPDDNKISENDIHEFISEVNRAYPHASLKRSDISFFYSGLIPIDNGDNNNIKVTKQYKIIDHEDEGITGLISIIGVKYTTARDVAKNAIDMVYKKLREKTPKCNTTIKPIDGGDIENFNDFLKSSIETRPGNFSPEIIRHLVYNYGSEHHEILKYVNENDSLGQRINDDSPVIRAEILFGIKEEMAQKLSDVILRRTELGSAGYPGDDSLKTCAEIMAKELGWDEKRVQKEIQEVKDIYTPLT